MGYWQEYIFDIVFLYGVCRYVSVQIYRFPIISILFIVYMVIMLVFILIMSDRLKIIWFNENLKNRLISGINKLRLADKIRYHGCLWQ